MKKILLLTDFSKNAENAMAYAMRFFESKKCTFYVMYVHKVGGYVTDDLLMSPKNSIHDSITEKPNKKLNVLIEKLKNENKTKDYHFEIIIDYDVFTDAVNQAVNKFSIDFVVIGSNGASNIKEVIFGSNTINVIEKVKCKTLVIPSNYKFLPIKEFLVSLNSHCKLNNNLREDVMDFIEDFDLKLHVLRVTSEKDTSQIALGDKERLSLLESKYYLIEDVPVDYAVSSYLQTNTIDITAFIAQDKSLLERLFSTSSSKVLKSRMKLPLLVLHSH